MRKTCSSVPATKSNCVTIECILEYSRYSHFLHPTENKPRYIEYIRYIAQPYVQLLHIKTKNKTKQKKQKTNQNCNCTIQLFFCIVNILSHCMLLYIFADCLLYSILLSTLLCYFYFTIVYFYIFIFLLFPFTLHYYFYFVWSTCNKNNLPPGINKVFRF